MCKYKVYRYIVDRLYSEICVSFYDSPILSTGIKYYLNIKLIVYNIFKNLYWKLKKT